MDKHIQSGCAHQLEDIDSINLAAQKNAGSGIRYVTHSFAEHLPTVGCGTAAARLLQWS
jgi:hypothetical protein